jgi:SAM-dependent methyltransferase
VIGVDMTPEMLAIARRNAEVAGVHNVEFREGVLEALPVPDDWANVVISNGVLNLVPDKTDALAECFRVLRPGGRLQLADIVLDRPVPGGSKSDVSLWTGCIAGGLLKDELTALVEGAGFRDVEVRRGADIFGGAPQHSSAADFGTVGAGITGRKPCVSPATQTGQRSPSDSALQVRAPEALTVRIRPASVRLAVNL